MARWMAARPFPTWLALALAAITLPAAQGAQSSDAPSPDSTVAFAYDGPLTVAGSVTGSCSASGIDFPVGQPGRLRVEAARAVLTVRHTWLNATVVGDRETVLPPHQTRRVLDLPSILHIEWGHEGQATGLSYRSHVPFEQYHGFQAAFASTRLESAPVEPIARAPLEFWEAHGPYTPPTLARPIFALEARHVATDRPASLSGDVSLYLRHADVSGPDGRDVSLDEWRRDATVAAPGVAAVRSVRLLDAFLDLEDARFLLEPGAGTVVCQELAGRVEGALLAGNARGVATVGGVSQPFRDRQLRIDGDFALSEETIVYPPRHGEASGWVEASAAGRIDHVSVDRVPVYAASNRGAAGAAAATVGLAGLAAAGLVAAKNWGSLVGFLYARFGPERVLEHPRRHLVYQAVRENPGIDLTRLAAQLGSPLNTVIYHVRVLERTGKVGSVRLGKSIRLVPRESMPPRASHLPRVVVAQDPHLAFLRDSVASGPRRLPDVVGAIAQRFGLSRRGALHVVHRGLRRGVVVQRASPTGRARKAAWLEPAP